MVKHLSIQLVILNLAVLIASVSAGPITGYKQFKLGKRLAKKTKSSGNTAHYYEDREKYKNPKLFVIADEDKMITKIRVTFSYGEDYKYKKARAAYKRMVRAAIKKYGQGKGDLEVVDKQKRGGYKYTITTGGTVMEISNAHSYIHVIYHCDVPAEVEQPKIDEDI